MPVFTPLLPLLLVSQTALAAPLALLGASVFDGTGRDAIPDAVILVEGTRILAVGSRQEVPIPADATSVDLAGMFVVPGLVDAHIHYFQSGGLYTRPDILDLTPIRPYSSELGWVHDHLADTFRRQLASGLTAVVDMGGPMWNFDVRDEALGADFAPRLAVAGPLISTVERPQLDLGDPPIIRAASPRDARRLVKVQVTRRPDFVKVWYIVDAEQPVDANLPVLQAVISEAHRAGLRVAVHATQLEAARLAVEAGADILAHSIDDAPVDDAFIALMRQKGTLLVSTTVVYEGYAEVLGEQVSLTPFERRFGSPWIIASWTEMVSAHAKSFAAKNQARVESMRTRAPMMASNVRALRDAGIPVAVGTDAGNIGTLHGPSMHREMQILQDAGLSPKDVILGATRDAARVFSASPDIGTLEPGKEADLLVLDADPLQDVAHLEQIAWVVKAGRMLRPVDILPPSPEEVVQLQVDAYNARDIESFLSFFAEDATVARLSGNETVAQGRQAIRETYEALFAASPTIECHVLQRTTSGNMVVDHEFVVGIRGGEAVRATAIYEVRDSLIRKVWFLPKE